MPLSSIGGEGSKFSYPFVCASFVRFVRAEYTGADEVREAVV